MTMEFGEASKTVAGVSEEFGEQVITYRSLNWNNVVDGEIVPSSDGRPQWLRISQDTMMKAERLKAKIKRDNMAKWESTKSTNSQVVPWFILSQTFCAIVLWVYFSLRDAGDPAKNPTGLSWTSMLAGLESIWPGETALKTHENCNDLRLQAWRWLTYQWTHVGIMHIGGNTIMNLVLGWRIEKLHGNWKMLAFYNLGVLGGACCYFVNDVHISVVGMSGGCYSLLGMHWGLVLINWAEKKYRWITLFFLLLMAGMDLLIYYQSMQGEGAGGAKVSHSAHFGGALAGMCCIVLFGNNLDVKDWERKLRIVCGILGFCAIVFCFTWRVTAWAPMSIWDSHPWCWLQLVYNRDTFGDTKWHCVRCGSEACMKMWMAPLQNWTSPVTMYECLNEHGGYSTIVY
jgi:membrane associated rhomboid family serine protease